VFLFDFDPLYSGNAVGLEIHQMQVNVCALIVDPDGYNVSPEYRVYKAFRKDLREMAGWNASLVPDCVIMESASVYWSSYYRVLYERGVIPTVVNACHVKNIPG
jgi:hypothetical protein